MNFAFKPMIKTTGILVFITGMFMLFPLCYALYLNDTNCIRAFSIACPFSIFTGIIGFLFTRKEQLSPNVKDAHLIVFFSWVICALIGSFPYHMSAPTTSYADAIFESVAGYTTTGASSIAEFEMPHSLLLWKAITHWIGAMGMLVFIVTILPIGGSGRKSITLAESPEINLSSTVPRSKFLARYIYIIYSTMTFLEFILLYASSKMNAFEALITSLGSISTAGLMPHSDGISHYDSLYVDAVISTFTILSSLNFMIFIYLIKGNLKEITRNVEVKVFLIIITLSSFLVALNLFLSRTYDSFGQALKNAAVQVISILTTSGFVITDYSSWPTFCKILIFMMFFVGGCVASTSGSIKIMRIIIMLKLIHRDFFRKLHPRSVQTIKIGTNNVSAKTVSSITSFVFLYMTTFLLGTVVISMSGYDLETVLSTTASLMSTTGSALGKVGWNGNYSIFSPGIKLFMSALMIIGRLELFSVIMIFFPSFWNTNRARRIS